MNIIDIFPTPVGTYELGREFTDIELNFIDAQRWEEHIGTYVSVATDLLDHKAFSSLRLFV